MSLIKNTVFYETGILTNPTIGTVLYEAGVSGETEGKGLADIYISSSAAITVTYTTIYGKTVTSQIWTLTNPLDLGSTAITKIELAASLTGTLELMGNELLT